MPLAIDRTLKPHVVLVVGVNGTGKTTTIGKLAQTYRRTGPAPHAGGRPTPSAPPRSSNCRSGASAPAPPWSSAPPAPTPPGLAFDALARARADGADVLLIDTAGRLHNKSRN